jgi:hypothetical protein
MDSRRFSLFLNDLRYACKLADEAQIRSGSVTDSFGMFSLVFELSSGDVVFSTLDERLGAGPIPRQTISLDNSLVLGVAIAEQLEQIRKSA